MRLHVQGVSYDEIHRAQCKIANLLVNFPAQKAVEERSQVMKIIRYEDPNGTIRHAAEQSDGSYFRIEGDVFGKMEMTREKANIHKTLAPVDPKMIWCIGQNYR